MTMQQERRLSERKTLKRLVYIELASANVGIVRNISEGGLGFRALVTTEPGGPLPFWFSGMLSSGNSKRIEGIGELVWTDETKKIGGLRFTQLPVGISEQIRSWPNESNQLIGSRKDSAPDLPALHESLPSLTTEMSTDRSPTSKASPEVLRPEMSTNALQLPKKSNFEQQSRRRLKAICASVLAVTIAVLFHVYRRAGEVPHTSQIPSPASNLSSEGGPIGRASAGKSKTEGTAAQAAPQLLSTATQGIAKANVARPPAPETSAGDAQLRNPLLPHRALIVQVASFAHEANARELAERLRQRNFPAFVSVNSTKGVFYRVQVGPYVDEESARITQSELGRAGFKPFIFIRH